MHSTAGLAAVTLCALLLQLVDNLALFKPAAGRQPLMLLPGRPPVPLPLDQPLMLTAAAQQGNKVLGQCVCQATCASAPACMPGLHACHNRSAPFACP